MAYCKACIEKELKIAELHETIKGLKAQLRYRERKEEEEPFGLSTPSSKVPFKKNASATIMACAAGKDVYVEKPMTVFIKEGRWMTSAARKYKRVVTVGTQGRSGAHIREVIQLVNSEHIGKIHSVRIGTFRNIMPGFGKFPDANPPLELDYDMWLGPAPKRPYSLHRALYHFRWFWDYSGGQMTNLGAHDLDFVYLLMRLHPVLGGSDAWFWAK